MKAQDKFSLTAQAAKERWHDLKKAHEIIERAAEEDPIGTMQQLLDLLREERRLWRRYLRSRYGIGFRYVIGPGDALAGRRVMVESYKDGGAGVFLPEEGEPPPEKSDKWVLVAPERLPRTRSGWLDVLEAASRLELWNTAWSLMNELAAALKELGCGEKVVAEFACKMWLHVARQEPIFYARYIEPEDDVLSPLTREVAAAGLTGWMRARTSLTQNKRLREALAEGGGRSEAEDKLRQELPGAVLAEWPHWRQEGADGIARRVWDQLEHEGAKVGDQMTRKKKRVDVQPDSSLDATGSEAEDLLEVERWETLQQDIRRLRGWVRSAGFSEREAQVYELDMKTNHNTGAIARELGIDDDTVRGFRKRYRDKIRRRAAGL
jgi:hypothetical protein